MSSRTLFLDTRFGLEEENYRNSWNISTAWVGAIRGYELSVESVHFPNTVYPINEFNNKLYLESGAVFYEVVIPPNSYTGTELADEIEAQLIALNVLIILNNWNVVYNQQSRILSIAGDLITQFSFVAGDNNLYNEIGFFTLGASQFVYVGEAPINIAGTESVYIRSNISGQNYSSHASSNILAEVPVVVPFGYIVMWENQTEERIFVSETQLDTIRIELIDAKGNFYKLPKNAFFKLQLKVYPVMEPTHSMHRPHVFGGGFGSGNRQQVGL